MSAQKAKSPAAITPKHGLYLRAANGLRLRDQRVRRMVQRMRQTMAWLEDSDVPACRGWAELEILCASVFIELKNGGIFSRKSGEARRLLNDYRILRQTQLGYSRELGMTPASRAVIQASASDAALDLIGQMATADEGTNQQAEGVAEEIS